MMRISKIGLRLGYIHPKHPLHEYNEYSFGKGWTLVKSAHGTGKTAIVNAISSVLECPSFVDWPNFNPDFSDGGGEIALDFFQDNTKVTVTKKWEGNDDPPSSIYSNGLWHPVSEKIVKPFFVTSYSFDRSSQVGCFNENEIACLDSLTEENPQVIDEINSFLASIEITHELKIRIQSSSVVVSRAGKIHTAMATGEELLVRLAVLSAIHKYTGAPLIFDDWYRGLGEDHIQKLYDILATLKEECPDGQFIFTQAIPPEDFSEDEYYRRRVGLEDYIDNVVILEYRPVRN